MGLDLDVFYYHVIICLRRSFIVCCLSDIGMGTSAERSSCSTNYYSRGDVLPGIWVDGMDVLAVKSATDLAIKYATEVGPLVLEVKTYR